MGRNSSIVAHVCLFFYYVTANCPHSCSGHGTCDKYSRCNCDVGFSGGDCSRRTCPSGFAWADQASAIDLAHAPSECAARGLCDRLTGVCACMEGFVGSACQFLDCASECSNSGRCFDMKDRAARTRNTYSKSFSYATVWDSGKIKGCVCDSTRSLFDCSGVSCPTGDDPLTLGQVNEVQLLKCQSVAGSFSLYYNGVASPFISYSADQAAVTSALLAIPGITDITVMFTKGASLPVCSAIPQVVVITFNAQFGPQPPLLPYLNSAMVAAGGAVIVSGDGSTSFSNPGSSPLYTSIKGTKENDKCANRGLCLPADGVCSCYNTHGDEYGSSDGYGNAGPRGDCGYIKSGLVVSSCPGEIQCSGHGLCSTSTNRCACDLGWESGDCSELSCPLGLSWFDYPSSNNVAHTSLSTCSDMGLCDSSTGKCTCRVGFSGQACQYMSCPDSGMCSGHGRCADMQELAAAATANGDKAYFTYGNNPNNANTWDANRIYGCLCDEGFEGYDCSLHKCPSGDDPGTYMDHSEVQLIRCTASGGTFTLSFRQRTTPPISYNATALELQRTLSALPSLGPLSVFFSQDGPLPSAAQVVTRPALPPFQGEPDGGTFTNTSFVFAATPTSTPFHNSTVCSPRGTQTVVIVFDTTPGPLPSLNADYSNLLDNVNIGASVKVVVFSGGSALNGVKSIVGTTENAPCNNRGLCNIATGSCACFPGWSSSDGQGGAGLLNDCGYRNEQLYNFVNNGP